MKKIIFFMLVAISCGSHAAMDKNKTIYKCMQGKKITYTDEPCINGTEVDVLPTQGLDKKSGKSLKGKDVRDIEHRDMQHEYFIKPLVGWSKEDYRIYMERMSLSPQSREECYKLDSKLLKDKEAVKTTIDKAAKEQAELNLFETRKRFKVLKC
jgi:hypothetical protein